ncbi:MAG: glycine cleavage system protein GcvH [Rhodobacteraceae bacterium]|nr:glycine cleavage system protein GcvH [Paracoccaceae bacterium]
MKYTEDHEWVRKEGDIFTIGITEYASEELGDVVYVDLPEEGDDFSTGDDVAVIESVKAASEIIAPMAGTIVEINEELVDNPALVNEDPIEKGWFFKIEAADPGEYNNLMSEKEYQELIS